MKKILSAIAMLVALNSPAVAQNDSVQKVLTEEDVMFGITVNPTGLSEANAGLLTMKMEQILGRCNAAAAGNDSFFIVEPKMSMGETLQSEGLVQNVASMTGELVLSAKNRYNDAIYHTATIPLKAVAKGDSNDECNMLVKSIKPSDAAYVRFVRNARKNIVKYVADHPEEFVRPAKEEPQPVQPEPTVPEIDNQPEPAPAPIPVAKPEPAPVPAPAPAPAPAPVPAPVPESKPQAAEQPQITISEPGWNIAVKGCEFDATSRLITLTLSITNTLDSNRFWEYTAINNVIKPDGTSFRQFGYDQSHRDYPRDIPVTVRLYIKDVYSNPGKLSYVDIRMDRAQVEIRNLPVK